MKCVLRCVGGGTCQNPAFERSKRGWCKEHENKFKPSRGSDEWLGGDWGTASKEAREAYWNEMEESGKLPRVGDDKKSTDQQRAATSAPARRATARCPPTSARRVIQGGGGGEADGNETAREKDLEKEVDDLRQEAGESSQRHTSEKEEMGRWAQEVRGHTRGHTRSTLAPTSFTLSLPGAWQAEKQLEQARQEARQAALRHISEQQEIRRQAQEVRAYCSHRTVPDCSTRTSAPDTQVSVELESTLVQLVWREKQAYPKLPSPPKSLKSLLNYFIHRAAWTMK